MEKTGKNLFLINGVPGSLGSPLQLRLEGEGAVVRVLQARLENTDELRKEIESTQIPSMVSRIVLIPLAAITSVPECEKNPDACWKTNVTDTANLARLVSTWAKQKQLEFFCLGVSSSHVYQEMPEPHRLTEMDATAPRSHYGRSKRGMEEALTEVSKQEGFRLAILRIFGILAIEQPPHFLLPGLIRRVRERNFQGVPGLDFYRDYLDARDVIEVLVQFSEQFSHGRASDGIYNVCSADPIRIGDLLRMLLRLVGENPDELGITAGAARADDIPWMVGEHEKLASVIGRESIRAIPIEQTLQEAWKLSVSRS